MLLKYGASFMGWKYGARKVIVESHNAPSRVDTEGLGSYLS